MNQMFALDKIASRGVEFADSHDLDAFGRLRTSNPGYVFDGQMTYSLLSPLYEQLTNGAGAAIAHDTTNRAAQMTFAATGAGGYAYMQSFEYFRYQPGRSQEIFITFNFRGSAANTTKFAGYSDGSNGIELQLTETGAQLVIYSDTTNGDQGVAQTNWNVDPFDGNGPSGKTLQWDKTQILVIDLQALYVGRVRIGFDIDGVVYVAHQFTHANIIAYPYMQDANRPIRCGMACTGSSTTTMLFICCSVISEGGQEDIGGFNFGQGLSAALSLTSGARTHVLSLQPRTTFAATGIVNRSKFLLEAIDVVVSGLNPVRIELAIGQALTNPAWTDVNATYSLTQYDVTGTLNGSPAIYANISYLAASGSNRSSVSKTLSNRYPITLNAAGAARTMGRVSLIATALGGNSAIWAALNWREIR